MVQGNLLAPPPVGRNAVISSAMRSIAERERVSDRYWTHHDKLNEMRIWCAPARRGTCCTCCRAKRSWNWVAGRAPLPGLEGVTKGECPITAVTFHPGNDLAWSRDARPVVEAVRSANSRESWRSGYSITRLPVMHSITPAAPL